METAGDILRYLAAGFLAVLVLVCALEVCAILNRSHLRPSDFADDDDQPTGV